MLMCALGGHTSIPFLNERPFQKVLYNFEGALRQPRHEAHFNTILPGVPPFLFENEIQNIYFLESAMLGHANPPFCSISNISFPCFLLTDLTDNVQAVGNSYVLPVRPNITLEFKEQCVHV